MTDEDTEIENTIILLLLNRDIDKTICPSEVARKIFPHNWRDKMNAVRIVAGTLAKEKIIVVTQKNKIVDISAKGPIRLKLLTD